MTESDGKSPVAGDLRSYSHLSHARSDLPHKRICVLGLGYIGLPTASLLAARGYDVLGVDVRKEIVDLVNSGNVHIAEPDLDVLVQGAVESKRLTASAVPARADVFVIAVPTPFMDGYQPDLQYVENAARGIAQFLEEGNLVILESTSPVGTTEKIATWISEERPDLFDKGDERTRKACPKVRIAYCPERVLPGNIIRELVENSRIVGGIDDLSTSVAAEFYRTFVHGAVNETDSCTAEMSKLAENTFRDVNIAYANELSMICDEHGIDVWSLIELANLHPRVNILNPGAGVGGHCIAIDPWFLHNLSPDRAKVVRAARESNMAKESYIVQELEKRLKESDTVAIFGLSYKANVGDLRESPSIRIVRELALNKGLNILVVEPFVDKLPKDLESANNIELADMRDATSRANAIVVLVRHDLFSEYFRKNSFEGVFLDFVHIH